MSVTNSDPVAPLHARGARDHAFWDHRGNRSRASVAVIGSFVWHAPRCGVGICSFEHSNFSLDGARQRWHLVPIPTLVVFQMYPVVTLEELKSVILRNMGLGAVGTSLVRRVAYRLLNVFSPDPFKFKIFWVDSDEHVRALFDLHRRYGTCEVMELLTEMKSMPEVVGGSSSSNGMIPCSPIDCPGPEVPMLMDGNFGEDSDEEFVPDIEESSESSDGLEFVPESQSRRGFLLPAKAQTARSTVTITSGDLLRRYPSY
ncbi:hypothetical protein PIB30_022201 [Stylosanthes scabra]|uniref:Uncharacterized protein n=1 Tax=Stylosanthes scabra TaxID=79078 RepID=A0ABU6Y698_9FABA|nr:hypothetical protein [Stylosanthes scabra]